MIELALSIFAVSFIIIGATTVAISEHREYNHGVCTKCGGEIKSFDMDSQGGIGWQCKDCKRSFWTSWVRGK